MTIRSESRKASSNCCSLCETGVFVESVLPSFAVGGINNANPSSIKPKAPKMICLGKEFITGNFHPAAVRPPPTIAATTQTKPEMSKVLFTSSPSYAVVGRRDSLDTMQGNTGLASKALQMLGTAKQSDRHSNIRCPVRLRFLGWPVILAMAGVLFTCGKPTTSDPSLNRPLFCASRIRSLFRQL